MKFIRIRSQKKKKKKKYKYLIISKVTYVQVRCKSFNTKHIFKSFVTFKNEYFLSI